jgi:hypothetical protein
MQKNAFPSIGFGIQALNSQLHELLESAGVKSHPVLLIGFFAQDQRSEKSCCCVTA